METNVQCHKVQMILNCIKHKNTDFEKLFTNHYHLWAYQNTKRIHTGIPDLHAVNNPFGYTCTELNLVYIQRLFLKAIVVTLELSSLTEMNCHLLIDN